MKITTHRACTAFILLYLALVLAGCATTTANTAAEIPAMHTLKDVNDERVAHVAGDPWEGFNRRMYQFNFYFDKYFYIPIVSGYEYITPTFAQAGVSNFFNNIAEIRTFYNSLLQANGKTSLVTFGRFATNTTIGIGGLFDPATSFGMVRREEDFGQTLGTWGAGTGPYLVMPVLGPGTVRSHSGFAVDTGIHATIKSAIDPFGNTDNGDAILTGVSALKAIDTRHQQKFRYYGSGYPFEYEIMRYFYQQRRERLIMK
jgi:phospholipid-binding lipoprotein MlaA